VRNRQVELWGWVETTAERQRVRGVASRFAGQVTDHVELLGEDG
jgi:hypothetical protein